MITSVKNAIGHILRRLIKSKKGVPLIPNESKQELFAHLPFNERKHADATAKQLFSDFHLNDLYENSSADNYRQNLFYLEMLERAFSEADVKIPQNINADDIGPSDWFYVKALYAALKWWDSLKPGGVLIIVNQGEVEHLAQKDMLLAENIRPVDAFQHPSQLYQYKLIRYVLVAIRAMRKRLY